MMMVHKNKKNKQQTTTVFLTSMPSAIIMVSSAIITTTLLLLFHHAIAVHSLFVQPPYKVKPYPELKLSAADRLGVSYKSIAYDAGKAASLPGFALSLNAEFGAIGESTFNALRNHYCGWSETKSRVFWKQGRKYTLLDFLPPLMQATSGLHFQSSRTPLSGLPSFLGGPDDRVKKYTEQEVLLTSNVSESFRGTLHDVLYLYNTHSFIHFPSLSLLKVLGICMGGVIPGKQ